MADREMVHDRIPLRADWTYMSFLTKRRPTTACEHTDQVTFEIAGMSRSVCEDCGKVSVGYVEDHFSPERIYEVAEMLSSLGASDED